ncbi:hypothetical protein JTB14_024510 [Gonioctena quinquepunctata]|nr:hypothetical protein JTB14_024510 [Gonioctena quinquepunctata]
MTGDKEENMCIIENASESPIMIDVTQQHSSEETATAAETKQPSEETTIAEKNVEKLTGEEDTILTSHEGPILGMKTFEKPLNTYDHELLIEFVLHSLSKPKTNIIPIEKTQPHTNIDHQSWK